MRGFVATDSSHWNSNDETYKLTLLPARPQLDKLASRRGKEGNLARRFTKRGLGNGRATGSALIEMVALCLALDNGKAAAIRPVAQWRGSAHPHASRL